MSDLIIGDATTVFPLDMIAIPAYQAYLLSGTPAMQVYIRAGETLVPTGGNVEDVQEVLQEAMGEVVPKRAKRRKKNPWIAFNSKFKFRPKRKNESSQEYLRKRTKAARLAYNKGGKK